MDIEEVIAAINTALANPPFQIDGAGLASPRITTLLTDFTGGDALNLVDAGKVSQDETSITINGHMPGVFLSFDKPPVTVQFTAPDDMAQILINLSAPDDTWNPTVTWPLLAGTYLSAFSYRSTVISLNSLDTPALQADFPAPFGGLAYDDEIKKNLIKGLGLSANVTMKTPIEGLSWLLGGTSFSTNGPIWFMRSDGKDYPSAVLQSAPGSSVEIGGYSLPFAVDLVAYQMAGTDISPSPIITSMMQLGADVEKILSNETALKIPVRMRYYTMDPIVAVIESDLSDASPVLFSQIAELIDNQSIAGQIPLGIGFPALDHIGLEGVDIGIVLPTKSFQSVSATVSYSRDGSWSIFGDLITFDGLYVTFTYLPGGAPAVSTTVVAKTRISGGEIDGAIALPDATFSCELKNGDEINIKNLVDELVGSSVDMEEMTCTEFKIFGSVPDNQFEFRATIQNIWSFNLGNTPIELTSLHIDVEKSDEEIVGEIVFTWTVDENFSLFGRAEYAGMDDGWNLAAGTLGAQEVSVTKLVGSALSYFDVTIPDNSPELTLTNLNMEFNTRTHDFYLLGMARLDIVGTVVDFGMEVGFQDEEKIFRGFVWFGESAFEADFMTGPQKTSFGLAWKKQADDKALELSDLAEELGLPVPDIPSGYDLSLKSASFKYTTGKSRTQLVIEAESVNWGKAVFVGLKDGENNTYFFGLSIEKVFSLSNLPLLDQVLTAEQDIAIDGFKALAASAPITGDAIAKINDNIDPEYPHVPLQGFAGQIGIGFDIDFGGDSYPISLGFDNVADKGGESTADSTLIGNPSGGSSTSVKSTPPAQTDGTSWFNIQKSFGPVTIGKVGVRYRESMLWFLVNGSLEVAGLTLSLEGVSIGSPLASFDPSFNIEGIGLDYRNSPFELGGGLIHKTPPPVGLDFEFDGIFVARTSTFQLSGAGSFAKLKGESSMFLFAELDMPLGGPPCFFVTGLLGGFGYNSNVRMPDQDQVYQFPFVAGLSNPGVIGGKNATPLQVLDKITAGNDPWVTPSLGQNWIAAGLTFTSFELINSRAALLVEIGEEFTIALFGLSTASLPPVGTKYAQLELQLRAVLQPQEGVFSLTAQLTPSSFLLDKACVLTGGFAFDVWYGNSPYAGDFVITVGGYNGEFIQAPHYPEEPRAGFSWTYDSTVTISGGAYFALTPQAIMAGGALDVRFHSGNLKAWLTAHADMLIWFKPFHFNVGFGVSVGASYRVDAPFVHKTFTVELGADFTVWGPPTSGTATVHWWVISFTVGFGDEDEPAPDPVAVPWSTFEELLPQTPNRAFNFNATGGLINYETPKQNARLSVKDNAADDNAADEDDARIWIVRRNGFSFVATSAVPAQRLTLGTQTRTTFKDGQMINILPMQKTDLNSYLNLTVTKDGVEQDLTSGWGVTEMTADIPTGLWGTGSGRKLRLYNEQLLPGQLNGFSVQAPESVLGPTPGSIDVAGSLSYAPLEPNGPIPLTTGTAPSGDIPAVGENTIKTIEDTIMTQKTVNARSALYFSLQSLGIDPGVNGNLDKFKESIGALLTDEPLIVPARGQE